MVSVFHVAAVSTNEEEIEREQPTHRVRHHHDVRENEETPSSAIDESAATESPSIKGRPTSFPSETTTRKKYHGMYYCRSIFNFSFCIFLKCTIFSTYKLLKSVSVSGLITG